jgi:hypothetical protein
VSRAYYDSNIPDFIAAPVDRILGELVRKHEFTLKEQQRNAWTQERSTADSTRKPSFYDHTYTFLRSCGIHELSAIS